MGPLSLGQLRVGKTQTVNLLKSPVSLRHYCLFNFLLTRSFLKMVTINSRMKFINRTARVYRKIKKAMRFVEGVIQENQRLRDENDALKEAIRCGEGYEFYVEMDHHVFLDPEEQQEEQQQPEQQQLQLFGGATTENGGGSDGDIFHDEKVNSINADATETLNNEFLSTEIDSDDEFLCDALLSLSAQESSGVSDTVIEAAATLLSFEL